MHVALETRIGLAVLFLDMSDLIPVYHTLIVNNQFLKNNILDFARIG